MFDTPFFPGRARTWKNAWIIFLFAWLPAGLLLYITLSNVLSIVQQLYVKKLIAKS